MKVALLLRLNPKDPPLSFLKPKQSLSMLNVFMSDAASILRSWDFHVCEASTLTTGLTRPVSKLVAKLSYILNA